MESEWIASLQRQAFLHRRLQVGIGDDAAVVRWSESRDCVITTDMLADGVHFESERVSWQRIGHKSLAVNLSDLAAMAARPVAAVISVILPRDQALEMAHQLLAGLRPLAERFDVAIAGGDTNCWHGPLVINVTAIGEVIPPGPWLRSGAQPGDILVVTGSLGGSRLGHHLDFTPRVHEALYLHSHYRVHAAMDISDGLGLDLSRMVAASHCGAAVDLSRIPISHAAIELSQQDGQPPWRHAFGDGEDFELLMALPTDEADRLIREQPLSIPVTPIGHCVPEEGLWQQTGGGPLLPLEPQGYVH